MDPTPDFGPSGPKPTGDPSYQLWLAKQREWWRWHNDNPEIWEYFKRFSFEAVRAKRTRFSHWMVLGRVRWYVNVETTGVITHEGERVKLCNDHFAFYARYWKKTFPEHAGLFLTKRMIGEPSDSPYIGR